MKLYCYRCPACPGVQPTVALALAHQERPHCLLHADAAVPMLLMAETERALLALDDAYGLSPIRAAAFEAGVDRAALAPVKVEHLKANGILLPATQHALEWMYRHRATNGMAQAFLRVGGRRVIDLVAFAKLMRERRA